MTRVRLLLLIGVVAAGLVLASAMRDSDGSDRSASAEPPTALATATAVPAATATPANTPVPTAAPVPATTPSPTPTVAPVPTFAPIAWRSCVTDPDAYAARVAELEAAVTFVLGDYDGTYGFALHDLDCGTTATVNGDLAQYTASTGKLPFVIAVLRAVEEGRLEFAAVRGDLELVLRQSLDANANNLVATLSTDEVRDVLRIAGVSDHTSFVESWSDYFSTAADMTRLWASVLRGDQLGPWWTEYLLALASQADVPPLYETFYASAEMPGLQFGQKAGYAVDFGDPYYLVGSGFLRPVDGSSAGFAATLVLTTTADLAEPRRRQVFPVVVNFALEGVAEVTEVGATPID